MFLTFLTVVDLACGGAHTLAVGQDGGLYVWGSNSSGQVTALGGLLLKEFFEIKALFDPNFSLALEPDPRFRLPQSKLAFRMARRWVLKRKLQTASRKLQTLKYCRLSQLLPALIFLSS
jgi:hypothetical protein